MGIVDTITSKLGGQSQASDGKAGSILSGVMEMFSARESGGLQELISSFQQRGLGDVVSSWVGRGENKPISPDQVREGLGNDRVRDLAAKAGVSEDETARHLSSHLPDFVDKMTPDGQVPQGDGWKKGWSF
ncbi:YidB family protein [Geotalea toluenoxydans]|uniref:YidB family protein n=1 Tax=Geotalea toluenoxydans TaxID=421624 RepID=UPI000B13D298|nr:YidB family protein [Geotalea toluenoxydans]